MKAVYSLPCDPSFVVTESAAEALRDVEEFVDYDLLFLCWREIVKMFRDDLDRVVRLHTEALLPYLRKRMHPCDGTSRSRPDASDTNDAVSRDVNEAERLDQMIRQEFYVGGGEVLD